MDGKRRDVQQGHLIFCSVPISGQLPKPTSIIIVPKNTAHREPKSTVKIVAKICSLRFLSLCPQKLRHKDLRKQREQEMTL